MVDPVLEVLQGRRDGPADPVGLADQVDAQERRPTIRSVSPANSAATSSGFAAARTCSRHRPSIAPIASVIKPARAAIRS